MEDLAKKYILQAEHNLHFLKELDLKFPNDFFDWKIMVLFYTAIHLTKGFLIRKTNKEYQSHEELNKVIAHRGNEQNSTSPVNQ